MSSRLAVPLALALLVTGATSALAAAHRMFVTSATGTGNLGSWPEAGGATGAAAGNQVCRTLAAAAGLAEPDTFRAWLSNAATDAYCRVSGFTGERSGNCGQPALPDAGPWERTDGLPFAAGLRALVDDDAMLYPAMYDENGDPVPPSELFTGTEFDGTEGLHCSGWTSASGSASVDVGFTGVASSWWTSAYTSTCDQPNRLLCFQPGAGEPLADFERPGAYAFVTSVTGSGDLGSWPDAAAATGLAAGDAICATRAAEAALPSPDTFLAWLSAAAVDAIDRLPGSTPWKRLDGVRIAANKSELTTPSPLDATLRAPISLTETGEFTTGQVLTGTFADGTGAASHCDDWTSNSSAENAMSGFPTETRGVWTENAAVDCDGFYRLYCFSTVVTIFRSNFDDGLLTPWSNY